MRVHEWFLPSFEKRKFIFLREKTRESEEELYHIKFVESISLF